MRAIITFHSIDNSGSIVSYPVELFAALLNKLRKSDIPIISLGEMLTDPSRQGVVLTFDDGMQSVYKNALPILKDYAAKAHLFVTTGGIENNEIADEQSKCVANYDMLTWNEIIALQQSGIHIDGHTHTHPDLRQLTRENIMAEFEKSSQLILSRVGIAPEYFAYPFGYHSSLVRECAASFYKASVTTELKPVGAMFDVAALPRLDSYYLQSAELINNLDSFLMTLYLKMRNVLRNVKGTQCKANAE